MLTFPISTFGVTIQSLSKNLSGFFHLKQFTRANLTGLPVWLPFGFSGVSVGKVVGWREKVGYDRTMQKHWPLLIIVGLYLLIGSLYAAQVPAWQAP